MVTIKQVETKTDLKHFVQFPFTLYKNAPYWVPPLIKEEIASFDPKKNPVFEHAEATFFLAYKAGNIVGRIAAIINRLEVEEQGLKKMRFGWFDFVDDPEVSKALLDKVAAVGHYHQLAFMEGPVGFSNLDKVGVLTEGFDHIGTMITWYNYPYYASHYEKYGFVKEKEYSESKFLVANANPKLFQKANLLIKKRYDLRALSFKKSAEIMPWVDAMFDLFNETYTKLSSFVRITDAQKEYFKKKYLPFIDPEYIKFVVDAQNTLVAFAITMPSFSKALQKARGRLFPMGIFYLLQAKRKNKDAILYLIGIHPHYQNKGVTAILFNEYHETFKRRGVVSCVRTPSLVDNKAIHQLWKRFDPVVHKRRNTYRKPL